MPPWMRVGEHDTKGAGMHDRRHLAVLPRPRAQPAGPPARQGPPPPGGPREPSRRHVTDLLAVAVDTRQHADADHADELPVAVVPDDALGVEVPLHHLDA